MNGTVPVPAGQRLESAEGSLWELAFEIARVADRWLMPKNPIYQLYRRTPSPAGETRHRQAHEVL